MIKLERPSEPALLRRNKSKWTNRWHGIRQDGKKSNWATQEAMRALREPLLLFSYRKCAFCESRLHVTSYVEIEHYHAKSIRPDLVFDWMNLFPSCSLCNSQKRDLDHGGSLLKPDVDDPESLLWLHPDSGELQPHPALDAVQKQRVEETITAYELQRGGLCQERLGAMKHVKNWLVRSAREAPDLSEECMREWRDLIDPYKPWKFVIRHVLVQSGSPELAQKDREASRRKGF